MATSRRRPISVKLFVAVGLIAVAMTTAVVALVMSTVAALTTATVAAVVAGMAAVAILVAEVHVVRRLWAFDRASLADSYRERDVLNHEAQLTFVDQMANQVKERDEKLQAQAAQLASLRNELIDIEIQTALAHERLSAEKARVQALQTDHDSAMSDLASARADLLKAQDALAASEAASVATRAEMVAWEQAMAAEKSKVAARGRRAAS